jgi:hypothetical protein
MLSSSLKDGHLVDLYTWFGKIKTVVKQKEGELVCCSIGKGDVEVPVSKLFFRSKAMSPTSRWSYGGASAGEYIEYEEVVDEPKTLSSNYNGINLTYGAKS